MIFNYLSSLMKGRYADWKNRRLNTSVLMDNTPILKGFGGDIYMSDLINNCIDRIATEFSKIDVVSVVEGNNRVTTQNDDITRLFRFQPNPLQTTKDFLASCEWLRRKTMHCFIFPQWEEVIDARDNSYRRYTAFYPLNPASVMFGQNDSGEWGVRFTWQDGTQDELPLSDIIHLKWRRGTNLIVGGGDDNGNADVRDTRQSLDILTKVMQGLPVSIEAGMKLSGVYTVKTVADADELRKRRDVFENHIFTSKAGIVAIDLAGSYQPVAPRNILVPEATMKFLKNIIRERYGVSDAIIEGKYGDDEHAAFYETCLEDSILEFQQAFSQKLFTPREQDIGHRVKCYYNKVEYYSTANKIQLAQIARETGIMTLNQIAEMFGLEPFEGGDKRLQSLNFVNLDKIDEYQMKGAKSNEQEQKSSRR